MAIGDVIVAVDIGTSQVRAVMGQISRMNQIEIMGFGASFCKGMKRGLIIDIESTAQAIREAVLLAENSANLKIESAYVNTVGSNISIVPSTGSIPITSPDKDIGYDDITDVLKSAKGFRVSAGKQIIDIIPHHYRVDEHDGIVDPIGMTGSHLQVEADVLLISTTSAQNLVRSMEKAGLRIDGIIAESLADSEIALTPDERELGVLMLDVGAGTTYMSVFKDKRLVYYNTLPIGGEHISNDIVIGLKTSYEEADKLKKQYGVALKSLINNDQEILVSSVAGEKRRRAVKISEIVEIIEPRIQEIFSLVEENLVRYNMKEKISAGAVLTGQGISNIYGSDQAGAEGLNLPVRLGKPKLIGILKPTFATSLGMIKYISGIKYGRNMGSSVSVLNANKPYMGLWEKFKGFLRELGS